MSDDLRAAAAIRTLEAMGYTHEGGELWRPPLGPVPDFDLMAVRDAEIERLRAQVAELEQRIESIEDDALERGERWGDA